MATKNEVPNVIGLYMEDISRFPMLKESVEVEVGRRARLGYGTTIALTTPQEKLAEIIEHIESGSLNGKSLRKELYLVEKRISKLRKERCDKDLSVTATWPEQDRWMAKAAEEAITGVHSLLHSLRSFFEDSDLDEEAQIGVIQSTSEAIDRLRDENSRLLEIGHEAVNELVRANARFVIAVAKKYQNKGLDLSELISAGNEGMIKAARKFDERMGVRYVSYAAFWIGQQIQKELDYSVGAIRPTQTQMVRNRRVWRIVAEARREGRELTVEEIQERTKGPEGEGGYTIDRIQEALDTSIAIMSLDAPVDRSDGGSTTFAQFIGSDDDQEELEAESERHDAVMRAIREVLTEREAKIIMLYYGIGGQEEWPLADIGESLDLSRERARQLKDRALKKLADCRFTDALFEVSGVESIGEDSVYVKTRSAEEMAELASQQMSLREELGLD